MTDTAEVYIKHVDGYVVFFDAGWVRDEANEKWDGWDKDPEPEWTTELAELLAAEPDIDQEDFMSEKYHEVFEALDPMSDIFLDAIEQFIKNGWPGPDGHSVTGWSESMRKSNGTVPADPSFTEYHDVWKTVYVKEAVIPEGYRAAGG